MAEIPISNFQYVFQKWKKKKKFLNDRDSNGSYFIHIHPIGQIEKRERILERGEEVSEKAGKTRGWVWQTGQENEGKTKRNPVMKWQCSLVKRRNNNNNLSLSLSCMFKYEAVGVFSLFFSTSLGLVVCGRDAGD